MMFNVPMKLVVFVFLFILAMVSTTPSFGQEPRKANKEYELKAFHIAIKSYIQFINQYPANAEAMAKLGDCFRHINQLEESAEWYERAFTSPQQVIEDQHILYYGLSLMGLGQYRKAAEQFRKYVQLSDGDEAALGQHYYEMCNYAERNGKLNSKFQITPVNSINTPASDFGTAFFKNNQLVYSSARTDAVNESKDWSGRARNKLFLAAYKTGGTLDATDILTNQASKDGEGPVAYSPDGKWVFITRNNFVDGTRHISSSGMKLNLYIAEAGSDGKWRNETPFAYNDPDFSTGFPHFAADGTLYFASDRPGGRGGFDIYTSYKTNNGWSNPEILDTININTPGDEITPYFEGRTLYFASTWHVGYGGYDIFSVEKNNNRWSIARNLGVGVNSPRDDYAFIFDGIRNIGYFTSNRTKGKGGEDIYQVSKQTDEIMIRVLNASDRKPIAGAIVDFGDCRKGTFKTDVNGVLYFKMEDELNCRVVIGMSGFSSSFLELSGLGTRNSKSFEVELKKDGEQYAGVVIDVDNRNPLAEVRVQATAQESGQVIEDITNEKGEYILALSDNRVYQIRYSKVGYSDINRTFPTGNGNNVKTLGSMPIKKVTSTTAVNLPDVETELQDNTPIPVPPIEELPAKSYAIQVASAPQLNLNRFASLNIYGNVYYVNVDNTYKIRIGAFVDRAVASKVLVEIKKAGYSESFLVEEVTADVYDKILTDGLNPTQINGDEEESEYVNDVKAGKYKVQLGAYKDARNFDSNKVRNLGTVEKKVRQDLTLFLLTGYKTLEEAKKAMAAAQKAGFANAFVVTEEKGELKRVKP